MIVGRVWGVLELLEGGRRGARSLTNNDYNKFEVLKKPSLEQKVLNFRK